MFIVCQSFCKRARGRNACVKEGDLEELFYLKANGQVLLGSSKHEKVESTINYMVHHRGQLTVYTCLNDTILPSIDSPQPDDKSFT